jgi:hypothetical protein
MLKKLGLTIEEFRDLIQKLDTLNKSLNPAQRAVIERSFPTAAAAATTFGQDVTAAQLQSLLATDPTNEPFASGKVAFVAPNPPE